MKNINAGELKNIVTIQRLTQTQDQYKDMIDTWVDVVAGVRAKVEPASGGERVVGVQLKAEVSHKVTLRQSRSYEVKPTMRVQYDGRVLNIVSVLKDELYHRVLTLYCNEVVQ